VKIREEMEEMEKKKAAVTIDDIKLLKK